MLRRAGSAARPAAASTIIAAKLRCRLDRAKRRTERQVNEEKAAGQIDWLTGLLSRRAVIEAAQSVIARFVAAGGPVSAILIDLDGFENINDTFGHALGDSVLRRFGGVASRSLRRHDIIGRLGGEEFAIILPGTGPEVGQALAERIRIAVL